MTTLICYIHQLWQFEVKLLYNATIQTAAKFLHCVQKNLPFIIIFIPANGGSKFRKYSYKACEKSNIPLFVFTPRSPELNGCVERCNRTLRYEFYRIYDGVLTVLAIQGVLFRYMAKCN